MKTAAIFCLLFICYTAQGAVKNRECNLHDLYADGERVARPHKKFAKSVKEKYAAVRASNLPPNEYWTISHGDQPAAQLIANMVRHLADQSGLAKCLENPLPIYVVIQKNAPDRRPIGEMKAGILTLNRAILDLAETDDELAEIISHEMLHHTLAHSLLLIYVQDSYWYRAMGIGSDEGGGLGAPGQLAPWDYRREVLKSHYDSYEQEARRASIVILKNAGFDPWSLVSLWEKQLRYSEQIGGWPGFNSRELRAIIEESRDWLVTLGIQPRTQHSTEWVRALKERLPAE